MPVQGAATVRIRIAGFSTPLRRVTVQRNCRHSCRHKIQNLIHTVCHTVLACNNAVLLSRCFS